MLVMVMKVIGWPGKKVTITGLNAGNGYEGDRVAW